MRIRDENGADSECDTPDFAIEVVLMLKSPALPCPVNCPLRMSTGDQLPGEGLAVPATIGPQGFLVGLSGPATPRKDLASIPGSWVHACLVHSWHSIKLCI